MKIDTISYADVKQPPEIVKPEDNVIIRVCASKGVSGLSLQDAANANVAKAQDYIERINELSAITDKIYVWDYPYNYVTTNSIFPILHTLREDVRYYVEHSVKGMFINGQTDTCDFDDLKIYDGNAIKLTIGIKENAVHRGGLNLFGKNFGDYQQSLVMILK